MNSFHNSLHAFSLQSFFLSLLVCCFLCSGTTHAQNHFINQYQPTNIIGAQGDSYNVVATSDGGFVALNDVDIASGNPGLHQLLTKMDANGTVLWSRDLVNTVPETSIQEDHYQHICLLGEGDIAAVGWIETPSSSGTYNNKSIMVSRFDANGQAKWSKAYDYDFVFAGGFYISSTSDGYLLVGGSVHQDTCASASTDDTNLDVFLKLDGNGNLIWQKTETSFCSTDSGTGDLTLESSAGEYMYIKSVATDGNNPGFLILSSYSPQGGLNWQKLYTNHEDWIEWYAPIGIKETANGEFILAVAYDKYPASNVALLRFTASGNMVWQRTFDIDEPLGYNSPSRIELDANDFVVMANSAGKVYNFTSWGTLLQAHVFPNLSLSSITKASNGDMVFSGKHNGNEEVDAFFTLIRGNSVGYNSCASSLELPSEEELEWEFSNIERVASLTANVIALNISTPDFDINGGWRCITAPARKAASSISIQAPKLYPNPSHGKSVLELDAFTRSSKMVRVFTIQGQLISQQEMPSSQHSLDLQVGSPGLYLIQIELAGETFQKKWMVK
ncbi:MAG: T9SS type A sorting domain-containing protein [Bacteroidota bacterium]